MMCAMFLCVDCGWRRVRALGLNVRLDNWILRWNACESR